MPCRQHAEGVEETIAVILQAGTNCFQKEGKAVCVNLRAFSSKDTYENAQSS